MDHHRVERGIPLEPADELEHLHVVRGRAIALSAAHEIVDRGFGQLCLRDLDLLVPEQIESVLRERRFLVLQGNLAQPLPVRELPLGPTGLDHVRERQQSGHMRVQLGQVLEPLVITMLLDTERGGPAYVFGDATLVFARQTRSRPVDEDAQHAAACAETGNVGLLGIELHAQWGQCLLHARDETVDALVVNESAAGEVQVVAVARVAQPQGLGQVGDNGVDVAHDEVRDESARRGTLRQEPLAGVLVDEGGPGDKNRCPVASKSTMRCPVPRFVQVSFGAGGDTVTSRAVVYVRSVRPVRRRPTSHRPLSSSSTRPMRYSRSAG